jgi:hypothetical protein
LASSLPLFAGKGGHAADSDDDDAIERALSISQPESFRHGVHISFHEGQVMVRALHSLSPSLCTSMSRSRSLARLVARHAGDPSGVEGGARHRVGRAACKQGGTAA